jgi:hypothetical protein
MMQKPEFMGGAERFLSNPIVERDDAPQEFSKQEKATATQSGEIKRTKNAELDDERPVGISL